MIRHQSYRQVTEWISHRILGLFITNLQASSPASLEQRPIARAQAIKLAVREPSSAVVSSSRPTRIRATVVGLALSSRLRGGSRPVEPTKGLESRASELYWCHDSTDNGVKQLDNYMLMAVVVVVVIVVVVMSDVFAEHRSQETEAGRKKKGVEQRPRSGPTPRFESRKRERWVIKKAGE